MKLQFGKKTTTVTFPDDRSLKFKGRDHFEEVRAGLLIVSKDLKINANGSFQYKQHSIDDIFEFVDKKTSVLVWSTFIEQMNAMCIYEKSPSSKKKTKAKTKKKLVEDKVL